MAMIDYGAWLIKDGILVNENQFFMDMKEAVGWSDDDVSVPNADFEQRIAYNNYFAYAGDTDFTVSVYKLQALFIVKGFPALKIWDGVMHYEKHNRITNNRMSIRTFFRVYNNKDFPHVYVHMKRIAPCVWRAKFDYNGHRYKMVFGYGIDPTIRTWNRVKVEYLGRKFAKICDKELIGTNVQHRITEV